MFFTPRKFVITGSLMISLILRPAFTTAQHIDFESLNAPVVGNGGLSLGNQFISTGVSFNFPTVLNFGAIPGFAHSGTNAIEICYGIEFCTGPLRITFNTPQSHVKIWAGYANSLNSSQSLVMTAFNSSNGVVGQSAVTLGPSATAITIQTPLEVNASSSTISQVMITFAGAAAGNIFNSDLVFDDLEYDAVGTAPACPTLLPPVLTLTSPFDGEVLTKNVFNITGVVSTLFPFEAYPYTTLQITATSDNGTTRTSGPSFLSSFDLQWNGFTNFLFPGKNVLTFTIKDCAGTWIINRTVYYRPDITSTFIHVIDENNVDVPGAQVYADGSFLGFTNSAGTLVAQPALNDGAQLVARKLIYQKDNSTGFDYRVYLTSMEVQNDGSVFHHPVSLEPDPTAPQVLQILPNNVLIGLHVTASVEWDASDAEMADLANHFAQASGFLFNATDGQFVFEQVDMQDDQQNWDQPTYRIYGNQDMRDNTDTWWDYGAVQYKKAIKMARPPLVDVYSYFSAYPPYVHEFGHYKFGLDDEYNDDDRNVKCTAITPTNIGLPIPVQPGRPTAACIMHDPSTNPKFCSNVPSDPHVQGTNQGSSSCWSDIVARFSDDNNPVRWQLRTPDTRGVLMGTINNNKIPIPSWLPAVNIVNHSRGPLCAPAFFWVEDQNNQQLPDKEIWLSTSYGQSILEGQTGDAGSGIWVTGLHVGDKVGSLTIDNNGCRPLETFRLLKISDTLPTKLSALKASLGISNLKITVRPSRVNGQVQVRIVNDRTHGIGTGKHVTPRLNFSLANEHEKKQVRLQFEKSSGDFVGVIDHLAGNVEGKLEVLLPGDSTAGLITGFTTGTTSPDTISTFTSFDGLVSAVIPAYLLPERSRVLIGPSIDVLPKLSDGLVAVGSAVNISTPDFVKNKGEVLLRFYVRKSTTKGADHDLSSYGLLHFNPEKKNWEEVKAHWIPTPGVITTRTRELGSFVLVRRAIYVK